MASILVTGGAGFIGSHLVRALVERGERVRVLDDLSSGSRRALAGLDVELIEGDVCDRAAVNRACRGVRAVFHEAAMVSVPQSVAEPERSWQVNADATLQLLQALREAGGERLVFAASSAAYGDTETLPKVESMAPSPLSPYAAGKVASEHLLASWGRCYGLRTVSLRYFNIFGPGQRDDSPYTGVIAIFARALLEGRRPTIFGDGEQTRDFTYVENVVAANLAALERDLEPGVVINVGAGERISLNRLYRAMAEILGSSLEPAYEAPRAGDVRHSLASIERARALLGYEPRVDWRTGLERTLRWYRERVGR
ncbi:MAG TPA: SDR family oxidoreductase [Kofleriaceae bacterium]|nr:SDR family oxidoreductase [Kofleriaceae bacterium]